MLRRIRVRGFKSLHDVDERLAPLTVILGPNAAGKSNLLEAIHLLARVGTERTLRDAFAAASRGFEQEAFELPSTGLPGLLQQQRAELSLEADVDVGGEGEAEALRYGVKIHLVPADGTLSVLDERLSVLGKEGQEKGKPRIETESEIADDGAPTGHIAVRRRGTAGTYRKEDLGAGHAVLSDLHYSGSSFPEMERLREELRSWRTYYLDPRHAMREPRPPRQVNDIGPQGEHLAPFLYRLKRDPDTTRRFDAVVRAVRSAIPSIRSVDVTLDERNGVLQLEIAQDGATYSARVVSEGTLRILALCAIAANPWPAALVSFEEPENGVHPHRIRTTAELLASIARKPGRQVVVTTHSPEVVASLMRLVHDGDLDADKLRVLRCGFHDGRTVLKPLDTSLPLLRDQEVASALSESDDSRMIDAMYRRGWLDA